MRCKMLTSAAITLLIVMTTGCSTLEKVVYRPDINQGNYLAANDAGKIYKGMTKQQVTYTLGTPMLSDPFGSDTWYYVFRQQPGHEAVKQKTLELTFDKSGKLANIKQPEVTTTGSGH